MKALIGFILGEYTEPDVETDFKDIIPAAMNMADPLIKYGSLQKYIPNCEEASDYGSSQFPDE